MKIITVSLMAVLACASASLPLAAEENGQVRKEPWTNRVSEEGSPVIERGSVWSYYADTGVPHGNWKLGAGDKGWKSGPTHIGFETEEAARSELATLLTREPEPSKLFPVAYFRKLVDIPANARGIDLRLAINCDDGCIAYVNGVEVGRMRLPYGKLQPYMVKYTKGGTHSRDWDLMIIPKALLKPRGNVIAVEVHQSSADSSDMHFSAMLHTVLAEKTTAPLPVKSDKPSMRLTVDGEDIGILEIVDKPVDFTDVSRWGQIKGKAESNICFESAIDRGCHLLKPGQTGVWSVEHNSKRHDVRILR